MQRMIGWVIALGFVALVTLGVQRSLGAASNSYSHPVIVANLALTGQTAAIPETTLFTPTVTGLYRISTYMTMAQHGDGSSIWGVKLGWTDDAGVESNNAIQLFGASNPPTAYDALGGTGGSVSTIECVGGTPVTYSVAKSGTFGGMYSLYFTVERLQ